MDLPSAINALKASLGDEAVDCDARSCQIASRDYFWLSPILSQQLRDCPLASAVVKPQNLLDLAKALSIAYQYEVPITPRGKGTGNYGQAVPVDGGIVFDLTAMNQVIEVESDWITAETGCNFLQLEAATESLDRELQIIPSTTKSTLGGFIGGGAGGAGSVQYGFIWNDFVDSLEILPCVENPEPFWVSGEECLNYLHAFGTTGIITKAKVRLRPRRNWTALYFSFGADQISKAAAAAKAFTKLPIVPRLNTFDLPEAVALLPKNAAMPAGRISLRPMVDKSTVDNCIQIVEQLGGRFEAEKPEDLENLHLLSYNHFTLRAKQKRPEICHLQLAGDAMVEKTEAILSLLPDSALHLECRLVDDKQSFGGLLVSRFVDRATIANAIESLRSLGLQVVNVHSDKLGEGHLPKIENVIRTKAVNDPKNLLNRGRLPSETVVATFPEE
ncbi:FAD-binding oxidoreductase [Pelagicoccus albus]|uniref:FAD-binding oxidoreductase n=1 Tax=Pelagicoccus albus TaxID=415222 RepID=A0A7X1B9R4_9BACT|nr:FAD-binding oxidoreductase [Pelagicoccus albus]MBC2607944.1 FAD-binding oxidoreductase [Pelagicoccus albus]